MSEFPRSISAAEFQSRGLFYFTVSDSCRGLSCIDLEEPVGTAVAVSTIVEVPEGVWNL